jgi:transcription initiation factor TFIIIB Brf1 subunit/transcription initiation factor TFIIB
VVGFIRSESLGSVPDPTIRLVPGSDAGLLGSIRRVGNSILPDGAALKFEREVRGQSRKLAIPEHIQEAVIHYNLTHREVIAGLKRRETVAVLLFIFSKNDMRAHRTLDEICEVNGVRRLTVNRYLTQFVLDNGLKLAQRKPEDFILRFASRLEPKPQPEQIEKGIEIARDHEKRSFDSMTPRNKGASALYLALRDSGHKYTQRDVGIAFGLAEYTVREGSIRMRNALLAAR